MSRLVLARHTACIPARRRFFVCASAPLACHHSIQPLDKRRLKVIDSMTEIAFGGYILERSNLP